MVNRRVGLVQVHVVAILVGLTGLFGKLLPIDPAAIVAGRTIFGSLALLAAIALTGTPRRIRSLRDTAVFAACGAMLALHWYSFFLAIQVSTVAIGVLAFSSFPVFVTLLEPIVHQERPCGRDLLIAGTIVAGLAVIALPESQGGSIAQGMAWGVLSGLLYAILSLISRTAARDYPPMTVAFHQQAFAALFSLPALIVHHAPIPPGSLALLALLGVVFTGFAQSVLIASLRHIPARTASVVVSLEPVYGILFARLFLGEIPTPQTLLGGLLVCAAVAAGSLSGREAE